MPEIHLRQPGHATNTPALTYRACGPLTKNKDRIQKFRETGKSRYIYQNKLNKVYIQHDMVIGDFEDLPRRIASKKILHDKAFNIAKYQKI